jgi:hypothetical protein
MSEPTWELLGGGGVVGGPIDYVGDWAAGTTYQPGQVVRFAGVDYLAVNPSVGQVPPLASAPPVGMVCLYDQILSAAAPSFDVQNISQAYTALLLKFHARGDHASEQQSVFCRCNGDASNNYDYEYLVIGPGTTMTANPVENSGAGMFIGNVPCASSPAAHAAVIEAEIPNYTSTILHKQMVSKYMLRHSAAGGQMRAGVNGSNWRILNALNRLTIYPNAGNFAAGSRLTIYGLLSVGQAPPVTTLAPGGIGTAFPVSPANGELFTLVDSLTAPTYQWTFRYVASITDTKKWVFVGGAPLGAEVYTVDNRTVGGSYGDPSTNPGPSITIPRFGDYFVSAGAKINYSGGIWGGAYAGLWFNGGATQIDWVTGIDADYKQSGSKESRLVDVQAGLFKMIYKFTGSPGPMPVSFRWISVTPVRVS